jgi:hypothetical protein
LLMMMLTMKLLVRLLAEGKCSTPLRRRPCPFIRGGAREGEGRCPLPLRGGD